MREDMSDEQKPVALAPEREGQPRMMTIIEAPDPDESGHWYSPAAVREMIDAAVAAERERLLREVTDLHMCQSINNQNHPAAWHDGVDAAADAIRQALRQYDDAQVTIGERGEVLRHCERVVDVSYTTKAARPCTCHPDDNPPKPCAKRFALAECLAAGPGA